jgi:hypothetical protein
MPPLTGSYAFSIVAQLIAFALPRGAAARPAAARTAPGAQRRAQREHIDDLDRPVAARYAIFAVAGSHVVMASVMAMTPIHLAHLAPEHVTLVVGTTIALHVFGMYGLSPLFGLLADRWGRIATILVGQALLAASLIVAATMPDSQWAVLVALFLLGAGWSAATVSGAALLTESLRRACATAGAQRHDHDLQRRCRRRWASPQSDRLRRAGARRPCSSSRSRCCRARAAADPLGCRGCGRWGGLRAGHAEEMPDAEEMADAEDDLTRSRPDPDISAPASRARPAQRTPSASSRCLRRPRAGWSRLRAARRSGRWRWVSSA